MRYSPLSSILPWVLIGLSILLILLLPSCGADDDDPALGPGGPLAVDLLETLMASEFAGIRSGLALPNGPPGCLTIEPWPPLDDDQDGVPNACRFDFDRDGCAVGGADFAFTTWGTIHVVDPGAAFGFTAQIPALSIEETIGQPARTRTRSVQGTRTVGGSASQVIQECTLSFDLHTTGGDSARVEAAWTAVFTAEVGASVSFGVGHPYPAGSTEITGTLVWNQGGARYEFDIVTVRALRIDPDCASPYAVEGEVWAVLTAGEQAGHLQMLCTGCGAPIEFEWVPER